MSEKYVIVTGGAHNIGAAISKRMKEDGFSPLVLDIKEPEESGLGDFFKIDLTDLNATRDLLSEIVNKYDVTRVVNNVGLVKPAPVEEARIEDFELLMNLNVRTALLTTQATLPAMKRAGFGRIVCNASRVVLGKELRTNYSASKGAIQSMVRTWALELAQHGVTVNCVAPGPIATTAFWENNPPNSERAKKIIDSVPVKRMGEPSEVANAASFFLDERSGFVTGQTIFVCGGITVGLSN
ncbi:MAG: SDR family oxidoreductase [Methylocystaceae bacterium]|nr:SDR family oxidoreductase [Methylocystaceae bacterium]